MFKYGRFPVLHIRKSLNVKDINNQTIEIYVSNKVSTEGKGSFENPYKSISNAINGNQENNSCLVVTILNRENPYILVRNISFESKSLFSIRLILIFYN